MVLPIIPVAIAAVMAAVFAGGSTSLVVYRKADQRTRNRWNRIVSSWLGIPIEEAARAPKAKRQTWKQKLEDASRRTYGKPIADLTNEEGEHLLSQLPPET